MLEMEGTGKRRRKHEAERLCARTSCRRQSIDFQHQTHPVKYYRQEGLIVCGLGSLICTYSTLGLAFLYSFYLLADIVP